MPTAIVPGRSPGHLEVYGAPTFPSLILWDSDGAEQLLGSWAAERQPAWASTRSFTVSGSARFSNPQKEPLSADGLFTGDWAGVAVPLPQVVGSRKYTYINPGFGEGRNERPLHSAAV